MYYFPSQLRSNSVNVVFFINDSLIFIAPFTPIPLPVYYLLIFVFKTHLDYFLSQLRSNSVNVVFFFSNSLIFFVPSSPILLPVQLFISFSFHSLFHLLFLFITMQIQFSQCSINLQWFTYLACSFNSNFVNCSFVLSRPFPFFLFIFILIHHNSYPV